MSTNLKIENKQLTLTKANTQIANLDELKNALPDQSEDLVLMTNAEAVIAGQVKGTIKALRMQATAEAQFLPVDQPTDCILSLRPADVSKWRFGQAFPHLPENYVGDGDFEDSFLEKLVFTSAKFVLATKAYSTYKKGLNFIGEIDYEKSYPVRWLKYLAGIQQGPLTFSGLIDPHTNRIELIHDLEVSGDINDNLSLEDLRLTLFSSLTETQSIGDDGIALEGDLILHEKGKKADGKSLILQTMVAPHGFRYIGLEAINGSPEPLYLDDLVKIFGLQTDPKLIPAELPQPGLEEFKAYFDLQQKSIQSLELKLRTGEWKILNYDKFKIADVYLQLDIHDLDKKQKDIEVELGAIMEIGGGRLLIYGKYPSYEIGGQLLNNSHINVADFMQHVNQGENKKQVAPDDLKALQITSLDFMANLTSKEYRFDLGIEGEWQLGEADLKLTSLKANYHSTLTDNQRQNTFLISGALQINDALSLDASYDKETDFWQISCQLAYDQTLSPKQLGANVAKQLPANLSNSETFKIEELSAVYKKPNSAKGNLDVVGKMFFPISLSDDVLGPDGKVKEKRKQLNISVDFELKKEGQNNFFTGHFYGNFDFKNLLPLELKIDINAPAEGQESTQKELYFGLQEGKTTSLPKIVELLLGEKAAEDVPNLTVQDLYFKIGENGWTIEVEVGASAKQIKAAKADTTTQGKKKLAQLTGKTEKAKVQQVKLVESTKDQSELKLTYLHFKYERQQDPQTKKYTSNCAFDLEAYGKINEDIEFTLMQLNYTYDFEKVAAQQKDKKQAEETPEEAPKETPEGTAKDAPEKTVGETPAKDEDKKEAAEPSQTTEWKISGAVTANIFDKKGIKMTTSFEKSTKIEGTGEKKKEVIKKKFKFAVNIKEVKVPKLDAAGKPVKDKNGKPVFEIELDANGKPKKDTAGKPIYKKKKQALAGSENFKLFGLEVIIEDDGKPDKDKEEKEKKAKDKPKDE